MKFEKTDCWGFEHALRGMRNPKNSHSRSDSDCNSNCAVLGSRDLHLAKALIAAGSEHRKFLRQIFVAVDITAPLYWWKEFDTYKVGTVANSTSTMHKLAATPITMDCFELDDYNCIEFEGGEIDGFVSYLDSLRKKFIETGEKAYWKELIRWLPESWLQTRTVTMNYENLYSMYHQRKNHKLNEWSGVDDANKPNFVTWVKSLPYAKEFIVCEEDVNAEN